MSRVFDALCRSREEQGLRSPVDAETFAEAAALQPPSNEFEWQETNTFFPPQDAERLVALPGQNGLGAEKFRLLRARLRHLQERSHIKRVVITSAVPEEGKTLVASNLAISLARNTSQRVLLIDGDLHKPAVARRLGLQDAPGISEWFSEEAPVNRFLYNLQGTRLWVLCAGVTREQPLTVLQSPRFLELFHTLSALFDWVLIDVPPMSPLADVNFWARQADGLLLVVRQGRTPRSHLQKGLEALDNPCVLGFVLNGARVIESDYYNHYYSSARQSRSSD